jgi:ubiquinone/menaquinone biosynthesis C-methylase UbiE
MKKYSRGFDSIAWAYDTLAKMVFGHSIVKAQVYFIGRIPDGSNILVLGGGSGKLISAIALVKRNCRVWYVEDSIKMIEKAKTRHPGRNYVEFIHGTESDIPVGIQYDVVITNFYFDLFSGETLVAVMNKIKALLMPESLWIAADFIDAKSWWQNALLKIMYRFFRATCGIEATRLPPWEESMAELGTREIDRKFFYGGFIKSAIYIFD